MLSINTNMSGIIAERSMRQSTKLLNEAIERMSTGFKINRAKDNAAGYAIVTDMTTKINAYQVAEENASMGLDMVVTATDILNLIGDHLQRLRDLAEQAGNDTYSETSLRAINAEANTRVNEIERLYSTAEYNGILLFDNSTNASKRLQAGEDGFIKPVEQKSTAGLDKLSGVSATADLPDGTYSISTPQELAKLAQMTNDGYISEGDTFILANDIDLKDWCLDPAHTGGWTPIGNNTNKFLGTFDGNGYKISNLIINRSGEKFQGLFGRTDGNAVIKNLGVLNVDITSDNNCTGAIVGGVLVNQNTLIDNCFSTGKIEATVAVGGICGQGGSIKDSYSTVEITASADSNGGLIGKLAPNSYVKNCFATGNVKSESYINGGLIGMVNASCIIENCYSTGDVVSTLADNVAAAAIGGLVGRFDGISITNCYSTGNVSAFGSTCGGFIGGVASNSIIDSCYSTGNVSGCDVIGGFIGSLSNVSSAVTVNILSSYCTGNVIGEAAVGGFLGYSTSDIVSIIENCYTQSSVKANESGAGFCGRMESSTDINLKNCSVLGDISNVKTAIFLVNRGGTLSMENCKYNTELNKTALPLVTDVNGVDITDDTIRAAVSECGFEKPFDLSGNVDNNVTLQIGIDSSDSSTLSFKTNISLDYLDLARQIGKGNKNIFTAIDKMLERVSLKQIEYGSTQNRLESALDEIITHYDNLVSSRSTLRDADIAEESSKYIQYQILQQAASTLLATANQLPAIALSLI